MTSSEAARAPLSKKELIGLVASVMALTALGIDMMLAALGDIGADFNLVNENDRQFVVIAFLLGSGAAQLFYGPLADRFGRRAVFIWSIVGFLAAALLCVVASAYSFFIAGRMLQGVAAAAGAFAWRAASRAFCAASFFAASFASSAALIFAVPST